MTTEPMTTGTIGTTKTTSASEPSTCPHGWLDAAHIGCFFLLQNVTVISWCAKSFSLNILLCSGTKPTWCAKIWEDSLWNQRLKRYINEAYTLVYYTTTGPSHPCYWCSLVYLVNSTGGLASQTQAMRDPGCGWRRYIYFGFCSKFGTLIWRLLLSLPNQNDIQ